MPDRVRAGLLKVATPPELVLTPVVLEAVKVPGPLATVIARMVVTPTGWPNVSSTATAIAGLRTWPAIALAGVGARTARWSAVPDGLTTCETTPDVLVCSCPSPL